MHPVSNSKREFPISDRRVDENLPSCANSHPHVCLKLGIPFLSSRRGAFYTDWPPTRGKTPSGRCRKTLLSQAKPSKWSCSRLDAGIGRVRGPSRGRRATLPATAFKSTGDPLGDLF